MRGAYAGSRSVVSLTTPFWSGLGGVKTATTTLTTTEAAVLALLAIEGESSPYDLTKAVERAIGHIWSPAKSGLYATLPRLAKDRLATKARPPVRHLACGPGGARRVACDGGAR